MGSTDSKKECGAFVVLKSGKRYLFNETATWEWTKKEFSSGHGFLLLQVMEDGKVALEAPLIEVQCVGGHSWFFKDAWWGQEKPSP